jgi:hypothetical protein
MLDFIKRWFMWGRSSIPVIITKENNGDTKHDFTAAAAATATANNETEQLCDRVSYVSYVFPKHSFYNY